MYDSYYEDLGEPEYDHYLQQWYGTARINTENALAALEALADKYGDDRLHELEFGAQVQYALN